MKLKDVKPIAEKLNKLLEDNELPKIKTVGAKVEAVVAGVGKAVEKLAGLEVELDEDVIEFYNENISEAEEEEEELEEEEVEEEGEEEEDPEEEEEDPEEEEEELEEEDPEEEEEELEEEDPEEEEEELEEDEELYPEDEQEEEEEEKEKEKEKPAPKPKADKKKASKNKSPVGQPKENVKKRWEFIAKLIEEGKWTKSQIITKVVAKFPEVSESTVRTNVTDAKNPKYNPFETSAVEDEDGIMTFDQSRKAEQKKKAPPSKKKAAEAKPAAKKAAPAKEAAKKKKPAGKKAGKKKSAGKKKK